MEKIKTKTIATAIFTALILLLSITSILFLSACNKDDAAAAEVAEEEGKYLEATVEKRDVVSKINLTGRALAETIDSLSFKINGELLFIADEGNIIMEGEKLIEVDNSDAVDRLVEIEMDIENAESFLRIAQINYQKALDENHIDIQLAELNTQEAGESTQSALVSLATASRSTELSLESAEQALEEAREILKIAEDEGTASDMQMAQYESNVESAENNVESIKNSSRSSQSQAESSYEQSVLNQSTTYWNNLSIMQSAEAQIAITAESIKQAELMVKAIKIELEAAEEDLQDYMLVAPYDCLITSISASEGHKIIADQEVIEIIDFNSIIIRADLPEVDKNKIKEDMEVNIYFDAYPDNLVKGNVFRIGQIPVTTGAGTFYEIFIVFTDLHGIEIENIYGLNAEIEIITSGGENILVVPIDYVYSEDNKNYVYKITGKGVIEKAYVEIGVSDLNYIEIISGLDEGDRIVNIRK